MVDYLLLWLCQKKLLVVQYENGMSPIEGSYLVRAVAVLDAAYGNGKPAQGHGVDGEPVVPEHQGLLKARPSTRPQ